MLSRSTVSVVPLSAFADLEVVVVVDGVALLDATRVLALIESDFVVDGCREGVPHVPVHGMEELRVRDDERLPC